MLILWTILSRDFSHFFPCLYHCIGPIVRLQFIQQFSPSRLQVCSIKSLVSISQLLLDSSIACSSSSLWRLVSCLYAADDGRQVDGGLVALAAMPIHVHWAVGQQTVEQLRRVGGHVQRVEAPRVHDHRVRAQVCTYVYTQRHCNII